MNKCNSSITISEGQNGLNNSRYDENADTQTQTRPPQRRLFPSLNLQNNLRTPSNKQQDFNTRRTVSAGSLLNTQFSAPYPPQLSARCPDFYPQSSGPGSGSRRPATVNFPSHGQYGNSADMMMDDQFPYYQGPSSHSYGQMPAFPAPHINDEVFWRGEPIEEMIGAYITSEGFISFHLRNHICLDVTIDKAVRLTNYESGIVMSLSSCGSTAAFIHPSGRVYQYCTEDSDARVEVCTNEAFGRLKHAKMWYKGVSFTAESCALVYLVDSAGTRSTSDVFSDMSGDFTLPIFLNTSTHDAIAISECVRLLQHAQYWKTRDGSDNWIINGVRIVQEPDGHVRIARDSLRYQLRTNPCNGNGSISTPFLHCTASVGGHIFVKRGSKRIHYDGRAFIVRNGSHSSGFDQNTQLKLFG